MFIKTNSGVLFCMYQRERKRDCGVDKRENLISSNESRLKKNRYFIFSVGQQVPYH